jgi:hypothetical protein
MSRAISTILLAAALAAVASATAFAAANVEPGVYETAAHPRTEVRIGVHRGEWDSPPEVVSVHAQIHALCTSGLRPLRLATGEHAFIGDGGEASLSVGNWKLHVRFASPHASGSVEYHSQTCHAYERFSARHIPPPP